MHTPNRHRGLVSCAAAVIATVGLAMTPGITRAPAAAASSTPSQPWMNTQLSPQARASLLVSAMTLAQKVSMLHGASGAYVGNTAAIPQLGIPALNLEDGRVGVGDGMTGVTLFPSTISAASSWDQNLLHNFGVALADEQSGKGTNVELGPTMNIDRVPQWGRSFESFSEDPYLTGELAAQEIGGIQSQGVIANANMYLSMNEDTNRGSGQNDIVSQRALQEIYLAPFASAVDQGQVGSVMCAYVATNGTQSCQNPQVLTQDLRDELGFHGWVMSDWGATHAGAASLNAGENQQMPDSSFINLASVTAALQDGQLTMSTVNERVREILYEMFKAGLFDNPNTGSPMADVQSTAHTALSESMAEQGTVLLQNTGSVLPLDASTLKSIAVIGSDAGSGAIVEGGGSSYVNYTPSALVTPLAGIKAAAGPDATVSYSDGSNLSQAAQTAGAAQVAVVFIGEQQSEGGDRSSLELPGGQDQLISAVTAANPNTIVVINSGGPVLMPWLDQVKGVIEAWYPGQQDGNAIAAVLFGSVDPGGHLPVTFPTSASDTPTSSTAQFPGNGLNVDYSEGLNVGYRGYDAENIMPLFPFGYGLSYTTFKFSNLHLTQQDVQNQWSDPEQPSCHCNGQSHPLVNVTATITNTGNRAGSDVAQLYVADPPSAGEPPRQLEGFQKVTLQPGRSTTVNFMLDGHALSYFDDAANGWVLPDGEFHLYIGDSSALANLPLQGTVTVTQTVGARYAVIDAPATMNPGSADTVNATFVNDGDYAIEQPKISLTTPNGWTASEIGTPPADVPVGQTATVQFSVNVPMSAQDSSAKLTASLKSAVGTAGLLHASARVSVPSAVTIASEGMPLIPVGSAGTVTVDLISNLSGTAQVTLTPNPPAGITVQGTTATVAPGQQVQVKLPVTVSSAAPGGVNQIQLGSTVTVNGTSYPLPSAAVGVSVPYSSLSAAYDNVGITSDADTSPGNLDGNGYSYSAQALAAAGLTGGQPFTAGGLTYTWPSAAAGSPDDALTSGQTINLTGSGTTLGFLGTGIVWVGATVSGTGTINYSDGTSQPFTITFPNWWGANNATQGNALAATLAHDNSPPGGLQSQVSLYDAEVILQPGKMVTSVTLPNVSASAQQGTNAIHIFSMAIGTPTSS